MKRILGILLLCGCLVGCARGGSGSSSLSGNWQFTVNSTSPVVGKFTLSGTLQEGSNNGVTGSLTLPANQTLPGPVADCTGPLTYLAVGTISGSTVALNVGGFISFTGTANSDLTSMSGSYTVSSQAVCDAGDSGTWSAAKTQ
jgi:hypothetical protein